MTATGLVRDMDLQQRIIHFLRPKQQKQRDAYVQACERLRPEERPVFRAHVQPPTPKQVDAQTQSALDRELALMVERGLLVETPYGNSMMYELVE